MNESGPRPEYNPSREKSSTRKRWILALLASVGLESAIGYAVSTGAENQRLENDVTEAYKIARQNHELVAPDWNSDEESLQKQLAVALTLTDQAREKQELNAPAIDNGLLIIASLEAKGVVDSEVADKLKQKLEEKRNYFQELAKTQSPIRVSHEIVQEQHYKIGADSLQNMLENNEGDCEGAAETFNAYIETVYPDKPRGFVTFKSAEIEGVNHVIFVIELEPGQWYKLEKPTPVPFELPPGAVLTMTTEIPRSIANQLVTASVVRGEAAEVEVESDPELIKKIRDAKSDSSVIGKLLEGIPQSEAPFEHPPIQDDTEARAVSFEEAEQDLQNTNPKLYASRKAAEKRWETSHATTIPQPPATDPSDRPAWVSAGGEFVSEALLDAGLDWHAISVTRKNPATTPEAIKLILQEAKTQSRYEELKQLILENSAYSATDADKKMFADFEKNEELPTSKAEQDKKQILQTYIEDRVNTKAPGTLVYLDWGMDDAGDASVTSFSTEEIAKIGEAIKAKNQTIGSLTIIPKGVVATYDAAWFTELPFAPNAHISIYSQDTSLDFLKKTKIRNFIALTINAPITDFSALMSDKILGISDLVINDPRSHHSNLIEFINKTKPTNSINLVNPGMGTKLSEILPELHQNFGIQISVVDFYAHQAELQKFTGVLELKAETGELDPSITSENNTIKCIRLLNPKMSADWNALDRFKKLEDLYINYVTSENEINRAFTTMDDVQKFSEKFPRITIHTDNPEYDMDSDSKNLKSVRNLEIKNGRILNNPNY